MSIIKKAYCRNFQAAFKAAIPVLMSAKELEKFYCGVREVSA